MDDNGKWTKESSKVERIFCELFEKLRWRGFSADQMDATLKDMRVKVNEEMNN